MAAKYYCDKCGKKTPHGYQCLVSRSRFPVEIRPAANQLLCEACLVKGAESLIQGHENSGGKPEREDGADLDNLHESDDMPQNLPTFG